MSQESFIDEWERDLIGKKVLATMVGDKWFEGTLLYVRDLFAPYVVEINGEPRSFIQIEGIKSEATND